jgi:hypothetical protein
MALADESLLDASASSDSKSSHSSAAVSITAGDLIIVRLLVTNLTAPTSAAIEDSEGNTYTVHETVASSGWAVVNGILVIATAVAGTSVADLVVTATPNSNGARWNLHVSKTSGQSAVTNTKQNTGSGNSTSLTLDATPGAASMVISVVGKESTDAVTANTGAGFAELAETASAAGFADSSMESQWDRTSAGTDAGGQSWGGSPAGWLVTAIEITEAGGAAEPVFGGVAPTLDGAAVTLGDGVSRVRSLHIPSALYATPFWLVPDGEAAR